MNESFREEFSSIQAFKFFTQGSLMDLQSNMKKYEQDIITIRKQL